MNFFFSSYRSTCYHYESRNKKYCFKTDAMRFEAMNPSHRFCLSFIARASVAWVKDIYCLGKRCIDFVSMVIFASFYSFINVIHQFFLLIFINPFRYVVLPSKDHIMPTIVTEAEIESLNESIPMKMLLIYRYTVRIKVSFTLWWFFFLTNCAFLYHQCLIIFL